MDNGTAKLETVTDCDNWKSLMQLRKALMVCEAKKKIG